MLSPQATRVVVRARQKAVLAQRRLLIVLPIVLLRCCEKLLGQMTD